MERTTHPPGINPPPTHTKVALSLVRVAALLSDELDEELQRSSGLGLSEVLVLLQLMFSDGQMKMADLADTLVVTRGGVTRIIDRLVAGGYIDRVPSAEDRRVVFARVTQKSIDLIEANQPVFEDVTARRIGALLDEPALETLHEQMHRLSCENPGWEPPEERHG